MAKAPISKTPDLDDETQYDVTVQRAFEVGGRIVRPGRATLKGKIIKKNPDAIGNVKPAA